MDAYGYLRVSTVGQATDGVSLEAQRAKIEAWCHAHDHNLVRVFADAGVSGGRADNRPDLQKALVTVCRKKAALVVYSLSRLARSTRDTLAIAERLDKAGADLVTLSEQVDTISAAGRMVFRLLAVLNEFERDLGAERTRDALHHKRRKGERISRFAPYGCEFSSCGTKLIEKPDEQRVVRKIAQWRARGHSMPRIAAMLNRASIPPQRGTMWCHQSIGAILKRHRSLQPAVNDVA